LKEVDEMLPIEALAELLNIPENELKEWSDGTFTIGNMDKYEYIVLEEPAEGFMEFLGKVDEYFIYKN
jgi:hypothetical protein